MTKIHDLISNTKIKILNNCKDASFFALFLLRTPMRIDNTIPTAATNGKDIIINEKFFTDLTPDERVFLLMHETMHIALEHVIRIQRRDPLKWNIACDYAINGHLIKYNLKMPEGGLHDPKYYDMSSEEIYELLPDDSNMPEENLDIGYGDPLTPEEVQDIKAEVGKRIIATEIENKLAGNARNLPKTLERFFEEIYAPKIPWKTLLARYMTKIATTSLSYGKRNRRLPMLPSRQGRELGRFDLVLDCSGSISTKEFNQLVSEAYYIVKTFNPKELGITQFDSEYLGTDILTPRNPLNKIEFKGGGGTRIKDTFNFLDTLRTEAIFIITDGHIWDLNKIDIPSYHRKVYWCVYNNKDFNAPFGSTIHMEF